MSKNRSTIDFFAFHRFRNRFYETVITNYFNKSVPLIKNPKQKNQILKSFIKILNYDEKDSENPFKDLGTTNDPDRFKEFWNFYKIHVEKLTKNDEIELLGGVTACFCCFLFLKKFMTVCNKKNSPFKSLVY